MGLLSRKFAEWYHVFCKNISMEKIRDSYINKLSCSFQTSILLLNQYILMSICCIGLPKTFNVWCNGFLQFTIVTLFLSCKDSKNYECMIYVFPQKLIDKPINGFNMVNIIAMWNFKLQIDCIITVLFLQDLWRLDLF